MQYVKIDLNGRAYTYAWAGGTPLAVGDWVVVPGNSYNPDPSTGRVLRLLAKCDFTGKVTILRQRIDVRKPQQVDSLTERVSRVTEKALPSNEWDDYGYSDNVLGQENGPMNEDTLAERVSRAVGKALLSNEWDDYGYSDNVLGQENGPMNEDIL